MRALAWLAACGMALLALAGQARAAQQDIRLGRYESRTIVTGTDLRSRPSGFAACLADVLVKVSGDPTVTDDPRLPAVAGQPAAFVADFDYWDRMSGISHHDEQGSSDRSYNLTVRFVPARVDAALRALGRQPWPDPRPVLVPLIHVTAASGAFDITREEPRAAGMRAALAESGEKYGMALRIPPPPLPDAAALPPGEAAVVGSLVLSEAAHGWVGTWHLDWQGRGYDWGLSGVNFDEAFRQAVRGAMQIVSGHGLPR